MSIVHPVVRLNATPPTTLPAAFSALNVALRALDSADTLVIDAATTALDSVLERIPQVLAVHGTPSALDSSGRYVLRLPSNGSTDQILIVANRTTVPLRLTTADGANALVASLAAGRIEAFVLSGSTIGAYALSSVRTGKAATSHTHTASEISGLPPAVRAALRQANSATDLTISDWHSVAFGQNVFDDINLTWSDSSRTFSFPSGITRARFSAAILVDSSSMSIELSFSKNATALSGSAAWSSFPGNRLSPGAGFTYCSTGWTPVSAGDYFRVIARRMTYGSLSVLSSERTWLSVEAY